MSTRAKPIPEGFRTVTPHLAVRNGSEAIEFYKRAFGAEEVMRMPAPDGKSIMHAALRIGDCMIMLNDECPEQGGAAAPATVGGTTVTIHLYVPQVDDSFRRAVDAGATAVMPPTDMFWGDRYGMVADPFGHHWSIATQTQVLTPQQMQKNAEAYFAGVS